MSLLRLENGFKTCVLNCFMLFFISVEVQMIARGTSSWQANINLNSQASCLWKPKVHITVFITARKLSLLKEDQFRPRLPIIHLYDPS